MVLLALSRAKYPWFETTRPEARRGDEAGDEADEPLELLPQATSPGTTAAAAPKIYKRDNFINLPRS